jgi:amino-acid N-acetyltransferase
MPSEPPTPPPDLTFGKARLFDVPEIKDLITPYATDDVMLPRSTAELFENIREYVVCRQTDRLVGCGSLHIASLELAEIRALAVAPDSQHHGIGRRLVDLCLDDARSFGVPRVFTLTLEPDFFARSGFREVPRDSLTQKVWQECYRCPKFERCDETAMILNL